MSSPDYSQAVADILSGLGDSPTPDEVYHAVRNYSVDNVVAAAAAAATAGGGGGGGSQTLAQVLAAGADAAGLGITNLGAVTMVDASLTITSDPDVESGTFVSFVGLGGTERFNLRADGQAVYKLDSGASFRVVSSSDDPDHEFAALDVNDNTIAVNLSTFIGTSFAIREDSSISKNLLRCGWNDTNEIMVGYATGKVGFYATPGVVQQTGVAVTAGGIHAALVNLGLITA